MKIRKNILWRVPVYCMAAGVVSFEILVRLLVHFKVFQPGPDGTVTTNVPLDLFIRGAVFAAAVLLGGALLRKMTAKEIFFLLLLWLRFIFWATSFRAYRLDLAY